MCSLPSEVLFCFWKKAGAGLMPPAVVRGFSGHWMAIYAIALAVLYSGAKANARAL